MRDHLREALEVERPRSPGVEQRIVARLATDLASEARDAEHGHLRARESIDGALRLVVFEPDRRP